MRSNGLDTARYIKDFYRLYTYIYCLCLCGVSQNAESTETVEVIGGDNLADLEGKVSEADGRSYEDYLTSSKQLR